MWTARARCWRFQTWCFRNELSLASLWKHIKEGSFWTFCAPDALQNKKRQLNLAFSSRHLQLELELRCRKLIFTTPFYKTASSKRKNRWDSRIWFCVFRSLGGTLSSSWHSRGICGPSFATAEVLVFLSLKPWNRAHPCSFSCGSRPMFWNGSSRTLSVRLFSRNMQVLTQNWVLKVARALSSVRTSFHPQ